MRSFFTVLVFLLLIMGNADYVQATCEDMLDTEFETVTLAQVDEISVALSSAFPFSLLYFGVQVMNELTGIQTNNFSDFQLSMFGLSVQPLGLLNSSAFDDVMQFYRICFLVIVILSVVKHVMEYIL